MDVSLRFPAVPARALPVLLLGVILACSGSMEPAPTAEVIGTIAGYAEGDPHVEVPESARPGVPFTVALTTYGSGCASKVRTEVVQHADRATITPYDASEEGKPCRALLVALRHEASLQFSKPGTASITFRGREMGTGKTITVERTIRVQ